MRSWQRFFIPGLVALLVLSACTIPAPPCQLESLIYPADARLQGQSLQLGVISASALFPHDLPGPLAETGAEWAVVDDVRWGYIEPQAPQNGSHSYEWDNEQAALDTRVQSYQQAGFRLLLVLRAWNPWARAAAPQGGQAAAAASVLPQSQYMADYATWVQAVVERYDGDGVDDAPHLLAPVHHYQIEFEATNGVWWQGLSSESMVADYLQLLRTAAAAARAADPQVKIILAGLPALDLLDGAPDAAALQDVISNMDPAVCGALQGFTQVLAARDAYDMISVHSVADDSGLQTLSRWLRALVPAPMPPVWITGATSAPALTGDPAILRVNPQYPTTGEALWASLQDWTAGDHAQVESWYRAEQARLAVQKWVQAAAAGFDMLALGLEQDRPEYENAALSQRDLAFQGLLDPADGFSTPATRPVVAALALVQSQLGGYTSVRAVAGLGEGVQAFVFTVADQPVYVLWADDGIAQGPGETPPTVQVHLPVHATQFTTFTVPTRRDQSGPDITALTATDGYLNLDVSETPVLVRGDWAPLFWPLVATAP